MTFNELTFVSVDSCGEFPHVNPWSPARVGNHTADCALGRRYFLELLDVMSESENPTLLGRVLAAQVAGGAWDGVEIGFAQAMAERLMIAFPA